LSELSWTNCSSSLFALTNSAVRFSFSSFWITSSLLAMINSNAIFLFASINSAICFPVLLYWNAINLVAVANAKEVSLFFLSYSYPVLIRLIKIIGYYKSFYAIENQSYLSRH
jgi:hypothetical protein